MGDLSDLDQQFEAMRINANGGYGGDDDESESDSAMDHNEKQLVSQHGQQSSMIFHGDSMSALRDGAEDKDEEDYPVEIVDDGQEEKGVDALDMDETKLTNKMELSEDDEDDIASLPNFDITKRFPVHGTQGSVSQSHSRQSSSSTFDID